MTNDDHPKWGGGVSRATSPITSYARIIRMLHAAKASASIEDEEPTKTRPRKNTPDPRKQEGGWVRIRDINDPRIHTPPQPMTLLRNTFSVHLGTIDPLSSSDGAHKGDIIPYLEVALLQVHSIF